MHTATPRQPFSRIALALLACALSQGCAGSGEPFRPEQLARAEAVIYVYRPGPGGAGPVSVFIDQEEIGRLAPREYLAAAVPPGEHLVRVSGSRDATRLILLAGGESAFLEANAPLFGGRVTLARLSSDIARERIARARRVEPATEPAPADGGAP